MNRSWTNWCRAHVFGKPLRRLLVIGDSISVHYAPHLEERLRGRYECLKKSGRKAALANLDVPLGANWGDSSMVLDRLTKTKLLDAAAADVALVNCGLHDIKRKTAGSECQIPLDSYRENLGQIADLFARAKTAMVWINSTPVDDVRHAWMMKDFFRFNRDCMEYNEAAAEIMKRHGVSEIDLYGFTEHLGPDMFEDHVHFTEAARKKQGQFIADWLLTFH